MTGLELEALGRRAVACKGWRWMPGMITVDGVRIYGCGVGVIDGVDNDSEYLDYPVERLDLPDLQDPATLGCLLALVREARKSDRIHLQYVHYFAGAGRWECLERYNLYSGGATEAEALVAALESAP